MDDSNEDQRLPHHLEPKQYLSLQQLDGKPADNRIAYSCTKLSGFR